MAADFAAGAADVAAACRRAVAVLGGGVVAVDPAAAKKRVEAVGRACGKADAAQALVAVADKGTDRGAANALMSRGLSAGWTAGRAKEIVVYLSTSAGKDPATVTTVAVDWLNIEADRLIDRADRCRREALDVEGMRAARRVGEAMAAVTRGPAEPELAARYERHLGNELERTLRLLAGLQAGRRVAAEAEVVDAEVVGDGE